MALSEPMPSGSTALTPEKLTPFLMPFVKRPLWVAFSGGVDSMVLLHLMVSLRQQGVVSELHAIHVNHGLSHSAQDWEAHCRHICQQWAVPCVAETVVIDGNAGVEQLARDARYRVFTERLPVNGCLLMGHHLDDQAETLLFRLFRGVGLDGLSGIPAVRTLGRSVLLRPLLGFSRQQIRRYACQHGLKHIEDESNRDERFSRNYLRHSLIPHIEQQWPGVSARLAAVAVEAARNKVFIDEVIALYYQEVALAPPSKLWGAADVIDLKVLGSFDAAVASRIIRYWLKKYQYPMPARKQLEVIFTQVIGASHDAEPVVTFSGHEFRRYHNKLVVRKPETSDDSVMTWDVRFQQRCTLGDASVLELTPPGALAVPQQPLTIRYRAHVPEKIKVRVHGRSGSKTIKRWLQEYKVPPWCRDRVPFLFAGERMVAAAGVWICDGFYDDQHNGSTLTWHVDGCC